MGKLIYDSDWTCFNLYLILYLIGWIIRWHIIYILWHFPLFNNYKIIADNEVNLLLSKLFLWNKTLSLKLILQNISNRQDSKSATR
jgi:hypothetical protein